MASYGPAKRLRNHQLDLRDMLLVAGIGQYNAVLSIPYMNMLPSTTEPYAQGVQQLIKGLQRLLNKRGAKLVVDGGLGTATIKRLVMYAGPHWQDKSWAQLYADVIAGYEWPGYTRNDRTGNEMRGALGSTAGTVGRVVRVNIKQLNDAAGRGWSESFGRGVRQGVSGDPLTDLMTNPLAIAAAGIAAWWFFFRKPKAASSPAKETTP